MNTLHPYLNFNGNCREALDFYTECLQAELVVQTVGESAIAAQCPEAMQGQVLHATLSRNGALLLMASDMSGPEGWQNGTNMALNYNCTENEIETIFERLSAGGKVMEGVKRQFWGGLFCAFTDKFGIRWMLQAAAAAPATEREVLRFSVLVNASKETVWNVLLEDATYREWTSVFHPGSYAESDWQEGGKALFKTPEGDGMVSKIIMHRPAEVISFEHIGVLHDNKEITDIPGGEKWQGSRETYTVRNEADGTMLYIEQEVTPEYAAYMSAAWEKALQKIKALSEAAEVRV